MREVTEAHYLHERHGLEAVLRPPVDDPTALAWIPKREELLVATREGVVHSVDPVLGTRVLVRDLGEPARIAVHPDRKRYVVVCRDGTWQVGKLGGEALGKGEHSFVSNIECFFYNDYAIILGDELEKRVMLILKDGRVASQPRLPKGVTALLDPNGKLLLCRSTHRGLQVIPFGKGAKFPTGEVSGHRLRVSSPYVMGMTATGVAVWTHEGGQPQSMRMPEVTAADIHKGGRLLGMGTRSGAVALAILDSPDKRARPDLVKAFENAVTSCAFSTRGRWFATAGERVQIWSWEE